MDVIGAMLQGGAASLASYLAAHVLLCLVPAFFIAGGLSALVPQQSIVRFLGPDAPRWMSYSAAAGAGSLLAVCSCTVQPLFAGIYKKGAGLGPAITFLFFAPAGNILALSYTGVALGGEFATARILLALSFGIGIGLIMAILFRKDDVSRVPDRQAFASSDGVPRRNLAFLGALVALLLAGTLKLDPLRATLLDFRIDWPGAMAFQASLDRWVPVNEATGAEGLSLQGSILIVLLAGIGILAWRGFEKIETGVRPAAWAALALTFLTLLFAATGLEVDGRGVTLALTGRWVAMLVLGVVAVWIGRGFDPWDRQQWLAESWRFVKQIFPLLVVGVFLVGVIRLFIQPEWIRSLAGANTLIANATGVAFGVFMYFPTLVEVPVAKMFLGLGMHPGPLIAYLMADPELSLQSIIITTAIIGKRRAWTYVGLVAVFSTLAGLTYGAWVDGAPLLGLAAVVITFIGLVVLALHAFARPRSLTQRSSA